MNVLVCERHPWKHWPHGDCGGPGAPELHTRRLLHEAVELHQAAAARGDWRAADWLVSNGLDCPVTVDTGGF